MDQKTIEKMGVGESAYTVSWAMWVDLKRYGWLNPKYDVSTLAGGTMNMCLLRGKDGYDVWPPVDAR